MRIVHIEDFFHPDAGYQVNILSKYLVSFGHEVTVITAQMEKLPDYLTRFFGSDNIEEKDRAYEQAYGVKIIRVPVRNYISGRVIYDQSLLHIIHECKPDVLYVHGNDTFSGIWAIWNRKKIGCPIITDSHMADIASGNRFRDLFRLFYRTAIAPIVRKNGITVIRTADDAYIEKRLGIPLSQAPVISFGSDTMLCHPSEEMRQEFRRENGISEEAFVVLYAGKLDEFKGGKLLADLTCQDLKVQREVVFVIVGKTVGEYGAAVEQRFAESPYRVLRFPTQKYCDLARFFQAADLGLIPRQCSLSLFDMGACGLPVLAEDNNINIERCSHQNGWTFEKGSVDSFASKLADIIKLKPEELKYYSNMATEFILNNYDYAKKAREYEREIINTYQRNKAN